MFSFEDKHMKRFFLNPSEIIIRLIIHNLFNLNSKPVVRAIQWVIFISLVLFGLDLEILSNFMDPKIELGLTKEKLFMYHTGHWLISISQILLNQLINM